MSTSPYAAASEPPERSEFPALLRRLAHRWFVEFNPLYLVSAALVLGGCFLLSSGIAQQECLWATLGITAVSELYAFALVGGAALLLRINRRRPAVLLVLLFLLYLWDTTLLTETSAYLGRAGEWAAAAWLLVFAVKLRALGWAMRVRFSARAVATGALAAAGLAIGPRYVGEMGARGAGLAIMSWAFALAALYPRSGAVESDERLTPWARAVLDRVTRAAWCISAALVGAHVLFWATSHDIGLRYGVFIAPLLLVRNVRRESRAWAIVTASLVGAALVIPSSFAVTALAAGCALALRALRSGFEEEVSTQAPQAHAPSGPYRRGSEATESAEAPQVAFVSRAMGYAERARALTGAATCAYLAAWTSPWVGGAWPAHVVALDAIMTAATLLAVTRLRVRAPLVPMAASYAHFAVHVIPMPRSSLAWGAISVGAGFALLLGSLAITWRLRGAASAGDPVARAPSSIG